MDVDGSGRVQSRVQVRGPLRLASGRVVARLSLKQEGLLRQATRKGKGFEDAVLMALLREEGLTLPCRRNIRYER